MVFAHIPLWTLYRGVGLGNERQRTGWRLLCLKRFGSVTVLNGHIHRTLQVEGTVTFHTGNVYGISATCSRQSGGCRTNESPGGAVAPRARHPRSQLSRGKASPGRGGRAAGLDYLLGSMAVSRDRFLRLRFLAECRLDTLLLARLQVIRVPFDVLDNLFVQNLALETAQSAFHALAVLNINFSQ